MHPFGGIAATRVSREVSLLKVVVIDLRDPHIPVTDRDAVLNHQLRQALPIDEHDPFHERLQLRGGERLNRARFDRLLAGMSRVQAGPRCSRPVQQQGSGTIEGRWGLTHASAGSPGGTGGARPLTNRPAVTEHVPPLEGVD
jgi:hypothetical protein